MGIERRKPILVGGLGLSVGLWLWDVGHSVQVGELGVIGTMALGAGFWWLQHKTKPLERSPATDREAVEKMIAQGKAIITQLETEAPDREIAGLKQQLAELPKQLERQQLQLAIAGGKKTGKTTLKQVLEASHAAAELTFIENLSEADQAHAVALASDLIVFVITGDLTDSEWQILQQLQAANGRFMLVLNKQDHYLPEERALILGQLRQRVAELMPAEDVVAISASPGSVKVRQHQSDGSVQEWMEPQNAQVSELSDRLTQIITQERESLVLSTTWREAMELKAQAKTILNAVRRDRALPVVERYQWIAAAAAFANPVAALDLLATAAISAQMLVDLSAIYQQKFSVSQAQAAAGSIGKLMVKLGLVELTSQTISSILKSNAVTYVAGGAVQGVSAAYLTRLAGLSLIEYFQEQDVNTTQGLNLDTLGQKLQQVFQQNQRTAFLQQFVKQTAARFSQKSAKTEVAAS